MGAGRPRRSVTVEQLDREITRVEVTAKLVDVGRHYCSICHSKYSRHPLLNMSNGLCRRTQMEVLTDVWE